MAETILSDLPYSRDNKHLFENKHDSKIFENKHAQKKAQALNKHFRK